MGQPLEKLSRGHQTIVCLAAEVWCFLRWFNDNSDLFSLENLKNELTFFRHAHVFIYAYVCVCLVNQLKFVIRYSGVVYRWWLYIRVSSCIVGVDFAFGAFSLFLQDCRTHVLGIALALCIYPLNIDYSEYFFLHTKSAFYSITLHSSISRVPTLEAFSRSSI